MATGKRKTEQQQALFIPVTQLPQSASHPFYAKLNEVLAGWKFDEFVEGLCAKFYEEKMGGPSLAPGKYFRLLLIGYFEGTDSERGIAWRCSDSLSLRAFVEYRLDDSSAEHSTISRTRRLIDVETHQAVFQWVLKVLADYDLIQGKTGTWSAPMTRSCPCWPRTKPPKRECGCTSGMKPTPTTSLTSPSAAAATGRAGHLPQRLQTDAPGQRLRRIRRRGGGQ